METTMRFHLLISSLATCLISTTAQTCDNELLSNSSNKFSSKLYKEIASLNQHENLICSLWSAHMTLSMLKLGAQGDIADKMQRHLYLPEDKDVTEKGFRNLINCFTNVSEVVLEIANNVLVSKQFPIKEDYKRATKDIFNAEATDIDVRDPSGSAKIINDWVKSKTHNKIKLIIKPHDINEKSNVILVNAIYFNSTWKKMFDKSEISTFLVNKSHKVEVTFMRVENYFYCGKLRHLKAQFIRLPYKNEEFEMVVILPDKKVHLNQLEHKRLNFDYTKIESVKEKIILYMPKFEIESFIDLVDPLSKIGLAEIFNLSDFSRISDEKLSITKIIQKAYINVNEVGTEATGATVTMMYRSLNQPTTRTINVNRPFHFLICKSGTILFQGHVRNPESKKKTH